LWHIGLARRIWPLRDGDATGLLDTGQSIRAVSIVAGDDDGDERTLPVRRERPEKDGDDIGPSAGFGNWLKMEFSVADVEVTLFGNDE
jgi:hypothetical protein